jgi:hypothetical protein
LSEDYDLGIFLIALFVLCCIDFHEGHLGCSEIFGTFGIGDSIAWLLAVLGKELRCMRVSSEKYLFLKLRIVPVYLLLLREYYIM